MGQDVCASDGGRSEFFANTMPVAGAKAQRVAHGARGLAEPDALVVAAHRVEQQRDERAVEQEVDQDRAR